MGKTRFELRHEHRPTVGFIRDIVKDPLQIESIEAYLKPLLDLPSLRQDVEADLIPIPAPEDREGYHGERHFAYWLSGYDDARVLFDAIPDAASARCILDLGGASGRVTRHLQSRLPTSSHVYLAELNLNHVEFIAQHFPDNVVPLKVSEQPYLMLPDASCDVICAYSVFTHIDVFETSWLAEIRRVLRPGGHALLTLHTEHTWDLMPSAFVHKALVSHPDFVEMFTEGEPMPADRLVFENNSGGDCHSYDCNVFHHTRHIERQWGRQLRVLKIIPMASVGYQTAVLLRRDD